MINNGGVCWCLQIGKNPIGDGGVETLLNVVKVHRTVKLLSLEVGQTYLYSFKISLITTRTNQNVTLTVKLQFALKVPHSAPLNRTLHITYRMTGCLLQQLSSP